MRNTKHNITNKVLQILIVIILLIVAGILGFLFSHNNDSEKLSDDKNAVEWNGNQDLPQPTLENAPAIEIPGFKELTFIENQTTQYVNFYNPEHNKCYFQMNLYVYDELLWKSGNVLPGNGYYQIELDKPFDKLDATNGCLKIRCFKENGKELNSATVNFKLTIK